MGGFLAQILEIAPCGARALKIELIRSGTHHMISDGLWRAGSALADIQVITHLGESDIMLVPVDTWGLF